MNTQLSPSVNVNFTNVSLKEKFFSQEEIETIKAHEKRENVCSGLMSPDTSIGG